MVRIYKTSSNAPLSLKTNGSQEVSNLINLSGAQLLSYKFNNNIYGSDDVKQALIAIQNDKCCFCEARISHVSHGDIEHYRPKKAWKQLEIDKLTRPGYYWLAYDFKNLFLSCQICNQKYKKNYFPLKDPVKRCLNHSMPIKIEKPLIINPGLDEPSKYLTFNKEYIVPKRNNLKGITTILRTGLNRKAIVKNRFEFLETLEILSLLARKNLPESINAQNHFKKLGRVDSEYSLMVRTNFPDLV